MRVGSTRVAHSVRTTIVTSVTGFALLCGVGLPAKAQDVADGTTPDVTSATAEILARRVTIDLKQVSLKRAIDAIAATAGVQTSYTWSVIEAYTTPVSVHETNASLGSVFQDVLAGTGLKVVGMPGGRLAVVVASTAGNSTIARATGEVSGRVIDSTTGRGLSGATVHVVGTKLSAVTTDSGQFVLSGVPSGDQVVMVKHFGYRPTERNITVKDGEHTTVRVLMAPVANLLSGVVTTATGTQRRIEVGSDITTLNVDSVRRVAPITSVTDLLETRVPGLTVVHTSGAPGDPARLRLRGVGSVQLNNDPIVIVDGIRVYASQSDPRNANLARGKSTVGSGTATGSTYAAPSPLDQIDPNSIETIEVLKGPSATAIYGSDAATGVIVITTKHGHSGPATWNATLSQGINWQPGSWPTNYYRFGFNENGAGPFCVWSDLGCHTDSVVSFQALEDPRYTILSHGSNQEASFAVSGGVQTLMYSFNGATTSTIGNLKLPGSEIQRYDSLYGDIPNSLVRPDRYPTWSVGGSVTATPSASVNATLQSSLYHSKQQRSALQGAITTLVGKYLSPTFLKGPLLSGEYERASDEQSTSTNAATVRWRPSPWLPQFEATGGINTIERNDLSYVPFGVSDAVYDPYTGLCGVSCKDTTGYYAIGRGTSRVSSGTLRTDVPLFRDRVDLKLGGNVYSVSTEDYNTYTTQLAPGVSSPTQFKILCGSQLCDSPSNQATSSQTTYGWYVEPSFKLKSRFFANPGFRLDGGSGGAKSSSNIAGLSAFPRLDFSYVMVDREGDRPLGGFLSFFRPRVAFGYAGIQPDPGFKLRLYNIGEYNLRPLGQGSLTQTGNGCNPQVSLNGTSQVPAVCLNSLGNTLLRPERSSELEGGFESGLWNGRMTLTLTWHDKVQHDALLNVPVAPSVYSFAGTVAQIQKNVGVIRNKGPEMTASITPIESRSLGWTINGNLSKNINRVVRLNNGQRPIVINGNSANVSLGRGVEQRVQAGYPVYAEFARPILGYGDANGDGIIESSEIRYGDSTVYVGQTEPNYLVNVSSNLVLLNGTLSFNAAVSYKNGFTQFNAGACGSNTFQLSLNAPNTPIATQAAVVAACTSAGQTSQIGLIQTVNELRFQSMSVNYVVPRKVSTWFRVPRMSVALLGSNLGLHTNYRGKDPDVNAFSTSAAGDATADLGQLPEPRTWWLRINLGN